MEIIKKMCIKLYFNRKLKTNFYLIYLDNNFAATLSLGDFLYEVRVPLIRRKQSVKIQPALHQDNKEELKICRKKGLRF